MNVVAEEIFGAEEDTTQTKPTIENALKLIAIDKNNFVCVKDGEKIIAWTVTLPTSKQNMNEFLDGKITERELSERSKKNHSFETLYLMAGITLPEYQRKGLYSLCRKYQIEYFKTKYGIHDFYAMPFSPEGEKALAKVEKNLKIQIKIPSQT